MYRLIGNSISYVEGLEILEETDSTDSDNRIELKTEEIQSVIKKIEKLNRNEVRVIDLKPFRAVILQKISQTPEKDVWEQTVQFVKKHNLESLHTTRYFGFDNPSPQSSNPVYGYEMWITVTDDFNCDDVEIRDIPNGLYAVTTSFSAAEIGERWKLLNNWVKESEYKTGDHQWLEEAIVLDLEVESGDFQLDLNYPLSKENR